MTYNAATADRVRERLESRADFSEKKMFGGIAFFLDGNLCVGVWNDSLMVRVGLEAYQAALAEPYVSIFGPVKRPMRGWVARTSDLSETQNDPPEQHRHRLQSVRCADSRTNGQTKTEPSAVGHWSP